MIGELLREPVLWLSVAAGVVVGLVGFVVGSRHGARKMKEQLQTVHGRRWVAAKLTPSGLQPDLPRRQRRELARKKGKA